MVQPSGFHNHNFPTHVCKLNKALYGLKQAPHAWYHRLSSILLTIGFVNSRFDTSLFFKRSKEYILLILIYVDDIIVIGSSLSLIPALLHLLHSEFAIKDLAALNFFLGIEIIRDHTGLLLSQSSYVHNLLLKTKMDGAKPVTTPMASDS